MRSAVHRRAAQTIAASRIWGQVSQGENIAAERHEPKMFGDEFALGRKNYWLFPGRCLERALLPGLGAMDAAYPGRCRATGASGYWSTPRLACSPSGRKMRQETPWASIGRS